MEFSERKRREENRATLVPQFETSRRIDHSAANMFALVADVERYPEFVPLCEALRVVSRHQEGGRETVTATMTVAYKLLRETFTSRVMLDPDARRIQVNYVDGPFRYMENVWAFRPLGESACEVRFSLSYEFKSRMLQALMGAVFDRAFRRFADAFETRADAVYGRTGSAAHSAV
jgi:coenzyme Q-binding protein COQ10